MASSFLGFTNGYLMEFSQVRGHINYNEATLTTYLNQFDCPMLSFSFDFSDFPLFSVFSLDL